MRSVLVLVLAVVGAGCAQSNTEKDRKRELDRYAIQTTEAQRQRDEFKAQLDAALVKFNAVNAELDKAREELVKAQLNQTNADQTAAQLRTAQASLAEAQQKAREAEAELAKLRAANVVLTSRLEELQKSKEVVDPALMKKAADGPGLIVQTRPATAPNK